MGSEDYRPEYDALIGPGLSYYWAGSEVPNLKKIHEQHDGVKGGGSHCGTCPLMQEYV